MKHEEWKALNFEEACERVKQTRITEDMTFEERFEMLKIRHGI